MGSKQRLLSLCFLLVAAALSGCSSSTESLQSRQFKILVDPTQPIANRNAMYTMVAVDDTGFQAYKYLWDFDERYSTLKHDVKNPYHVFSDSLVHNISCFAQDSLDHDIGEAHVRIQCLPPTGTIALRAETDSLDWQTEHFTVTVPAHHYSLVYQWSFGDSTVTPFYDTVAVHRYPSEGDYMVRLTVYEGAFAFATDSIAVAIRVR